MDMCGMGKRIHGLVRDWISYYICLCRGAALITTGLMIPHYFAKYAVVSILMTYFTDTLDEEHLKDAVSLTIALDVLSAIFGLLVMTYVSEKHVNLLIVVISASLTYIAGLVMLFFSTVYPETISVGYFVGVVFLLAAGQGGGGSIMKAILMTELGAHEQPTGPSDEEKNVARSEVWEKCASILCAVLAATVLSSVQWKPTFISSASVLGVGISIFCFGIPLFHRSSTVVHPLDEPSNINKWKDIWKMIPMCIPFVLFGLVMSAGNTYYIEQTSTGMSVYVLVMLQKVCKYGSSYLFDVDLMKKITLLRTKRFLIVRIGFGLVVCLICCVVAFHFVVKTDLGIEDVENCQEDDYYISMSNKLLIPQFCLLGLMEGIGQGGLEEFLKLQVRTSMEVYASATSELVTVTGSVLNGVLVRTTGWFGATLSCSLLDRYYLLLIELSASNIIVYALLSVFYWKNREVAATNYSAA